MAVHLDRFVCPHKRIKESHQVYHILYGNPGSSNISQLLGTVRRFYRPGMSPKQAQMTFKNRLQCLHPGIIDEHIHRQINSHQTNREMIIEDKHDDIKIILNGKIVSLEPYMFNSIPHNDESDPTIKPAHQSHERITIKPTHQHKCPRVIVPRTSQRPDPQQFMRMQRILHSVSSHIVSAILRGVNIYDDKTYCLVDHLEYIMRHYGHHHYSYMDETDLKQMMSDIIKGYKIDKVKEHHRKTKRSSHNKDEHFGLHSNPHFPGHEFNAKYRTNKASSFNDFVDTDSTSSVLNFSKLSESVLLIEQITSGLKIISRLTNRIRHKRGEQGLLATGDMVQMVERKFEHHMTNRITREQFLDICPSVIYSLLQRSEIKDKEDLVKDHVPPSALEIYGFGTASVFVISLASLVGAVFVKLSQKVIKDYLMGMLLSLSVGCLVGDAILHLLSEVLVEESSGEKARVTENLTKQCALLASIYGFFLLELTCSFLKSSTKEKKDDDYQCQNEENETKGQTEKGTKGQREKDKSALAWMVIVGDAIHNFADGLAIGAAFSKDITVGLSTSIAVFCHELPHELGDFAALVSSGLSIKRAMVLNFISSLTAFLGLYIGILASSNDVARSWIFSAGAGMFIYVALANLIPEVLSYFKRIPNLCMFLSLNFGLLFGYVSMLLLAIYEADFKLP
ncbi:solute carrier family 39 (zinc transporter), member 12 [Mytilus galloprovincialis]|uniref:Solute carrier family 39 (Zinc transporter), member 12 n=1 Tax=Mytilus galloprovincialis TaxID=29158 RepID=A0A8B6DYY1_MYTGA|nr:solute carrier family 39 (zinc transporter), member 12 [Mytilus galloprovincialis]